MSIWCRVILIHLLRGVAKNLLYEEQPEDPGSLRSPQHGPAAEPAESLEAKSPEAGDIRARGQKHKEKYETNKFHFTNARSIGQWQKITHDDGGYAPTPPPLWLHSCISSKPSKS